MKAIIFDFDGVIHDSFEFHRKKIQEFSGINLTEQVFKDMHNGNFYDSIPEEVREINWEDYKNYIYIDYIKLEISSQIAKSIIELSKKCVLFIISSGGKINITEYLQNNDIRDYFSEVLGKEDGLSKIDKFYQIFQNHQLNNDECIFITDTLGDIIEGNKVKIKTLAVDFGYHTTETLLKGNPHKIISNLDEIHKHI